MYDDIREMNVYEVAAALGHEVCETCKEQVCGNPSHTGCVYDGPGFQVDGLTFCKVCGPEAEAFENADTDVHGIPLACDEAETTPVRNVTMRDIVEGRLR